MRKKIVITGDRGFLGGTLIHMMADAYPKKDFIGIDRKSGVFKDKKNIERIITDINDWLPTIHDVEAVVHLAALPSVRDSERRASDVIFDNVLASQKIIHQCIEHWKPKKLLIASSSSVYDGTEDHFMRETESLRPLSIYGATKLAVEQMTKTYTDNGRLDGIHAINMRIFTNYGPRQRDELSIKNMINSCLKGEPFPLYGNGFQKRDFIYVEDTCRAINSLLDSTILGHDLVEHNLYNIGTGKNISIGEVIRKVSMMIGKPMIIDYQPATIYDTNFTRANIDRITADTNWKPIVCFDDGLRNQIEWQKNEI